MIGVEEIAPSYSGSAETDVIYQERADQLADLGADGFTWCDDAVSSTKCDQHYTVFDSDTPVSALICHETGHAVGLLHGSLAYPVLSDGNDDLRCMTQPIEFGNLGTDNVTQINGTY